MMKSKIVVNDLSVVFFLTLALLLTIYLDFGQMVRIPLTLMYIFLLPGWGLLAALFPHKDDHPGSSRLILSVGLSIVIVPLIGLILNFSSIGVSLDKLVLSISLFNMLCGGIAFHIRRTILVHDRFKVQLEIVKTGGGNEAFIDKFLSSILLISIVVTLGAIAYGFYAPSMAETFTAFYILGPNGISENYSTQAISGEVITVILGVTNYEQVDIQYRIEKRSENNIEQIATLQLGHEETWEQRFEFYIDEPRDSEKLEFLLYRKTDLEPYRALHIWINPIPEAMRE